MTVDTWRIYFVDPCQHTIPEPKPKLVIIVTMDARPMGFLINSEIDAWIQINPENLAAQSLILAEEHQCLTHDSWVDCLSLFAFDEAELNHKRDFVSPTAKQSILAAVKNSKPLVQRLKKAILRG